MVSDVFFLSLTHNDLQLIRTSFYVLKPYRTREVIQTTKPLSLLLTWPLHTSSMYRFSLSPNFTNFIVFLTIKKHRVLPCFLIYKTDKTQAYTNTRAYTFNSYNFNCTSSKRSYYKQIVFTYASQRPLQDSSVLVDLVSQYICKHESIFCIHLICLI